jgi:HK97 family phage portal protein
VNKAAGFMELEADGYIGGRADSQKVADYGTFVQTYRALPWLYAAVTALAVAASKPVLRVYREVKGGKGEDGEPEVEQQEIQGTELNRLLELPNPWLSHRELRQVTVINLALAGNAYWNMVGRSKIKPVVISKKNPPAELWWMKPSQVEPLTSKLGELEGYCYTSPMGKEQTLSASEVIHFRQVNPDSYHVGLGIMEPLTNTATLEFNAVTFQKKYLENDGTPPFIFEHPGEPSPDELKRFWSSWDARHKGTKNAGR